MEYVYVIVQFFLENWDQVLEAAEALVAVWIIVGALAPELADRLRQVRDKVFHTLPMRK